MLRNLQNFAKFQKFQLDNLVDFEKCCKTRIYLQRSAPIQPKTSEICQNLTKIGNLGEAVELEGLLVPAVGPLRLPLRRDAGAPAREGLLPRRHALQVPRARGHD